MGVRLSFKSIFFVSFILSFCSCANQKVSNLNIAFTKELFNKVGNALFPLILNNLRNIDVYPLLCDSAQSKQECESKEFGCKWKSDWYWEIFLIKKVTVEKCVMNIESSGLADFASGLLNITKLKIAKLNVEQLDVDFINNNVKITISSATINLSLTGTITAAGIRKDIAIEDTDPMKISKFVLEGALEENNGVPKLTISIKDLDMDNSLLNFFKSVLINIITPVINEKIATILNKADLQPVLFDQVALDFSLTKNSNVLNINNSLLFALYFSGVFINNSTGYDHSFPVRETELHFDNKMINLNFGAALSNTLMNVLIDTGVLKFRFNYSDVDEASKYYLSTEFYRFLIKPLYKKYGKRAMDISIDFPKPLNFEWFTLTNDKGMSFNTNVKVTFDILDKNGKVDDTFSVNINPKASIKVFIDEQNYIKFKVAYEGTKVTLATTDNDSQKFSEDFETFIDSLLDFGATTVNSLFNPGFNITDLYILGISLKNSAISWGSNTCYIGFDINVPQNEFECQSIDNSSDCSNKPEGECKNGCEWKLNERYSKLNDLFACLFEDFSLIDASSSSSSDSSDDSKFSNCLSIAGIDSIIESSNSINYLNMRRSFKKAVEKTGKIKKRKRYKNLRQRTMKKTLQQKSCAFRSSSSWERQP